MSQGTAQMLAAQTQIPLGQRRKIKHLPSGLGGLRRKSTSAIAKGRHAKSDGGSVRPVEAEVTDGRGANEDSLTHSTLSSLSAYSTGSLQTDVEDRSYDSFGSRSGSGSGGSVRSTSTARSAGSSLPSIDSFSSSVDSTTLPTPTTATGSFVLQQYPYPYPDLDTAELEHALSTSRHFGYPHVQDEHAHDQYSSELYGPGSGAGGGVPDTPTATPNNGFNLSTPTPSGNPIGNGNKSWVPHFGFGQLQLAKARAAVSTGLASLGEKRRKDAPGAVYPSEQVQRAGEASLAGLSLNIDIGHLASANVPPPRSFPPGPEPRDTQDVVDYAAQAEELLRGDARFTPMAEMITPPEETLQGLGEQEREKVKEEWANAQRARLTQCAQLCSQWPLSGYHLSKFGPNGQSVRFRLSAVYKAGSMRITCGARKSISGRRLAVVF